MPKRLTDEQRELKAELKRINVRITTLYKEGKKTGNMKLYESYVKGFNTQEIIDSGLLHTGASGAVQLSQNPRYYEGKIGQLVLRVGRYVPTLTQLKFRYKKEKPEVSYENINFDDLTKKRELDDVLSSKFTERNNTIWDEFTDEEVEEYIPELHGDRSNITFEELIEKMDRVIQEHREREDDTLDVPQLPFNKI